MLAMLTSGCSSVDLSHVRTPSFSLASGEPTAIGQALQSSRSPDPADSGFALLTAGEAAFLTRVALADVAQRSLDLQTHIARIDLTTDCCCNVWWLQRNEGFA
jgi:putative cardiolipin synthase